MGLFTDGFKLLKKASEPLYKTPKSIQETIEIMAVAENGIFEVSKNKYSKCYRFQDINYTTATEDEQIGIFERYCKFLNSLDCNYKITINNKNKNMDELRDKVLIAEKNDGFNNYRSIYNDIIEEKIIEGRQGIEQERYLTITIERKNFEEAKAQFATLEATIHKAFIELGAEIVPLNGNERLKVLYDYYHLGDEGSFDFDIKKAKKVGADFRNDLCNGMVKYFPEGSENQPEDERPKVAIIGKPNVGKSSLINKLAQEDRVIVSDIAGTTRDAIDTDIKYNGKEYVFIDTAGLRRKNKIKEEIERYSIIRAVTAVERADVVIIVIDATEGVTEQDAKIAGIAHDRGKGIIIAVNKWDAIEKDNNTVKKHTEKIRQILSFMPYAEILFISAKSGQRLNKIFEMIDVVIENNSMRVATGVLNEIVTEAVAMQQPPTDKGKRLKIYYVTQVAVKPPTFVVFVNDKNLMHFSYTRYLENRIRETFGFRGTALKFITRERKED